MYQPISDFPTQRCPGCGRCPTCGYTPGSGHGQWPDPRPPYGPLVVNDIPISTQIDRDVAQELSIGNGESYVTVTGGIENVNAQTTKGVQA